MAENPDFRLKAVSELLDGRHSFFIPSYQRGYRWDRKQVMDLLTDVYEFAVSDTRKGDFYCLQPVVVKPGPDGRWIVIDGQQRLTTLWLLLNHMQRQALNKFVREAGLYDISYETRPELRLGEPSPLEDIDSYYIVNTQNTIREWYESDPDMDYSSLEKVLFNQGPDVPKVKIIWYVTPDEGDGSDIESIRIFNNLNRGKIGLTNAELIKALFVLKCKPSGQNTPGSLSISEFAYQWDEIENHLHEGRFWLFLANKNYRPSSRIDIIFDFLTGKSAHDDRDYSYRRFQQLFDGDPEGFWKQKGIETFSGAWQRVLEVYHAFKYWFEDNELYHYIGYLVSIGVPMRDIFEQLDDTPKRKIASRLRALIKKSLDLKKDIDSISYTDKPLCHNVLLLFNIVTHLNSSYRFPFDRYKNESWDVEHVDSKTTNPLGSVKEKVRWLEYIEHTSYNDPRWPALQQKAVELAAELEEKNKDEGESFKTLYEEILGVAQENGKTEADDDDKDYIENLALLDAGTNRSYGNALFPYKRQKIIGNDSRGLFVPLCTKNLFLKYYSQREDDSSQWKNCWNDDDRRAYRTAIIKTLNPILS